MRDPDRTTPRPSRLAGVLVIFGFAGCLWADFPTEFPEVQVDPVVNAQDGRATFAGEWNNANWAVDQFPPPPPNPGTVYAQCRRDWRAVSSTGSEAVYPDLTSFILHDLSDLVTQELWDYNSFAITASGRTVTLWVFGGDDEPNDALWILGSGLGRPSVDDRGFIARLNDDPATDVQWFPGDPEPGDLDFDWETYYDACGFYGFNNSAFEQGLPNSVDGSNEVYEVAFRRHGGGIPPCYVYYVEICDPTGWDPKRNWRRTLGPTHVDGWLPPFGPHIRAIPEYGYANVVEGTSIAIPFHFVNYSEGPMLRTYKAQASHGILDTEIVPLDLVGHAQLTVTLRYTPTGHAGDQDTLLVTSPPDPRMMFPADTAFVPIRIATPPNRLEIPFDSISVMPGETTYVSAFGYDAAGLPLCFFDVYTGVNWTSGGVITTVEAQPAGTALPRTMTLARFTAETAGAGWVACAAGTALSTSVLPVSDTIFVQVGPVGGVTEHPRPSGLLDLAVATPARYPVSVRFAAPASQDVALRVFNAAGELVWSCGTRGMGVPQSIVWNGRDRHGAVAPAGVYFCQLTAQDRSATRKLVITK